MLLEANVHQAGCNIEQVSLDFSFWASVQLGSQQRILSSGPGEDLYAARLTGGQEEKQKDTEQLLGQQVADL